MTVGGGRGGQWEYRVAKLTHLKSFQITHSHLHLTPVPCCSPGESDPSLSPLGDNFHLHLCSLLPFHSPRLCGNGVKAGRHEEKGWVSAPLSYFFQCFQVPHYPMQGEPLLKFPSFLLSNKLVSLLVCGSCGTHIEVFGHKHLLIHY